MPPINLTAPRFYVDKFLWIAQIDGIQHAGFQKCSEIRGEVTEIEYSEGGAFTPQKSPGRVVFPNVTLERGQSGDFDLFAWFEQVIDITVVGPAEGVGTGLAEPDFRKEVDIIQLSRTKEPLFGWRLLRAWPRMFAAGEWDAEADEKVINKVELVYEGFVKLTRAI